MQGTEDEKAQEEATEKAWRAAGVNRLPWRVCGEDFSLLLRRQDLWRYRKPSERRSGNILN